MAPKTPPTFKCTMEGNYKGTAEGTNTAVEKPYSVKVTMTLAAIQKHGVLSTWKSLIAPDLMPRLYPDFQALTTYRLEGDAVCSDPSYLVDNIHLLTLPSLKLYVKENRLPINVKLYLDAESLRRAILNQEKDPDGYKVTETTLAARHGHTIALKDELEKANEDVIAKNTGTPSLVSNKSAGTSKPFQRHKTPGGANYYTDADGNKVTKGSIPDDAEIVDVEDKEESTPPVNKEI